MHDRRQDDLHRVAHLASWHHHGVGARHERVRDHAQEVREIDTLWITEADHHEALIRCWDVACDERIRCIHGRHTLEVDVGVGELWRDVFDVVRHTTHDRIYCRFC